MLVNVVEVGCIAFICNIFSSQRIFQSEVMPLLGKEGHSPENIANRFLFETSKASQSCSEFQDSGICPGEDVTWNRVGVSQADRPNALPYNLSPNALPYNLSPVYTYSYIIHGDLGVVLSQ